MGTSTASSRLCPKLPAVMSDSGRRGQPHWVGSPPTQFLQYSSTQSGHVNSKYFGTVRSSAANRQAGPRLRETLPMNSQLSPATGALCAIPHVGLPLRWQSDPKGIPSTSTRGREFLAISQSVATVSPAVLGRPDPARPQPRCEVAVLAILMAGLGLGGRAWLPKGIRRVQLSSEEYTSATASAARAWPASS